MQTELREISPALLEEGLCRTPLDHYVIWTGRPAAGRRNSVRAQAFGCLHEIGAPVSLRTLIQRAARLSGDWGLDPDAVRGAVRQHQSAQPAVVFLTARTPAGDYVAVTDIPCAGELRRRFAAGDVVLDRHGRPAFAILQAAAA